MFKVDSTNVEEYYYKYSIIFKEIINMHVGTFFDA